MRLRHLLAPVAATAAALMAVPASAAVPTTCDANLTSFNPDATDCAGWYGGNALSGSPANVATQTAALAALGATFTNFNDYTKIDSLGGATTLDFGTLLSGQTIIGIHFGAANGQAGNVGNSTGFFLFDLATPTQTITFNIPGSSGAVLYRTGTAVPEPATWAMMLLGFGAVGFSMRSTRRRQLLAQAA